MLENEPDTDQQLPSGDQPAKIAAPPAGRRRAASRPAGPPATAQDAPSIERVSVTEPEVSPSVALSPQVEVQAIEQPQEEVAAPLADSPLAVGPVETSAAEPPPVRKAAAKRPARKASAKKADAPESGQTSGSDGVSDGAEEPPRKRAARKRTAKKLAEPEDLGTQQVTADEQSEQGAYQPHGQLPGDEQVFVATDQDDEVVADGPAGWASPSATSAPAEAATADDESATIPSSSASSPQTEPATAVSTAQEQPLTGDDPGAAAEPDPGTAEVRDFRWLADPFAVPAADTGRAKAEPNATSVQAAAPEPATAGASEGESEQADDHDSADDQTADDDETGEGGNRRRRRRRGGRRRRRSGGDEDSTETDADDESVDGSGSTEGPASAVEVEAPAGTADGASADPPNGDDTGDDVDKDDSEGQGRRRRRRRRRGEETAASPDEPSDVVVRVREPRPRKKAASSTEVTGIEGSTRMEAKRQRRREGRDAGRRRAPILSEAEFLARRESVNRQMIIRQRADLTQIAVLEDGILVEHYVDRDSAASLIGNVYLGRVQNVLPSMEAAFIDIGRGRNAVLYAGEVDWESFGADGHNRKVEKVLKSGQMILVQVSKDPVGAKGARLSNHVSIPGRYIVYAPGGHLSGISRKLPDVERKRLKDILADLVGESASVIVRTAAEGASEEELVRDVNRLKAQWEDIERKVKAGNSPQLLYGEPDLTVRIVRDLFTEDFSELVIQGNGSISDAYDAIQGYVTHVAPHLQERIRRWEPTGDLDLFAQYRLDEQIAKALERKVFLPSGGSLVIDRTEAMTVIDVNTGKFTGTGGNLEATVTSNNLEAAEEIVNQLRLRDIGGIIVIDFIDMVLPSNRELLLRRLVECLGRDRTRHQVAEVTSLGLVQMTRKKIGTGLIEAFSTECPHCHGLGYELHDMPVDTQKQADGGTRETRPQNHRPRPGDGQRGGNGSRGDNEANGRSARRVEPTRDDSASDHGDANGSTGAHDDTSEQPDRGRSRRGRRAPANREQGGNPEHEANPQHEANPGREVNQGNEVNQGQEHDHEANGDHEGAPEAQPAQAS